MQETSLRNEDVQKRSYTVEQIATILDVSVRKAYDICDMTADFIVKRLGPRCLRINKASFDAWFDSQAS